MTAFEHLLVPTDLGEAAGRALDLAITLATPFDAKITLLYVNWVPPLGYAGFDADGVWPSNELARAATKELEAAFAFAKMRSGYAKIEPLLVSGRPWEQILLVARDRGADLIVMGTHGRGGLSRVLLGSVAEKVVRLSHVPVLTVGTPAEQEEKEKALPQAVSTPEKM